MLLALALALPFTAYSIFSAVDEARLERTHAGTQMLGSAQVTSARLDDHVNDIRSILMVLTSVVSVDPEKTAENDIFLRSLQGHIPDHISNLTVWMADGTNVGSLDTRLRFKGGGANTANRQFFKAALALNGTEMSAEAPAVSIVDGSFISIFAMPIWRQGRVVGVVAGSARLGALQQLLSSTGQLPEGAVMTVIDRRGVVLARSIAPEHWVGQAVKGVTSQFDGIRDGPSADGVDRIAGIATAHATPWRVYVGMPKDIALAPVYARLRGNLMTAGAALLFGLLLAGLIGDSIASPLRRLSDDALQYGAGNLAHRSGGGEPGEVGMLAHTLNTMAEQLQRRAQELVSTQKQLRQVTNNLPALISYVDADQKFRFANRVYKTWLGQDPEHLLGKSLVELYGIEPYARFKDHIQLALSGQRVTYERQLDTVQGPRRVDVTLVPDSDPQGVVNGLFVMMVDVTARFDAERASLESEKRLRMVADNIPALVTYVDRDERYRFVNAYLGGVFDVDPQALVGLTLRETAGAELYAAIAPHAAAALRGEEVVFQGMWTIKGRRFHYQSTYIPDVDEIGTVLGYYAMTFDISALKETQHRLDMLARVDTLTGLPNRRQFDERLHDAMGRTRRGETAMAVMFLDIDHFKSINDSLGHGAGDLVLKEFGARLQHQMRSTDIVARLAGDEFVVLVEGIHDVQELEALADKIVRAVRPPLLIEGRSISITTSMGIASYDGDGQTSGDLMEAADRALYAAKRAGRDRFVLEVPRGAEIRRLSSGADPVSMGGTKPH